MFFRYLLPVLGDRLRVGMKNKLLCFSSDPKELPFFVLTAGGSSNGRTSDSESEYLGSSPSPPAVGIKRQ